VDLRLQHEQISAQIQEGFARVFAGSSYILGKDVEAFEAAFASFSKLSHCVGVASGTDALEMILRATGIGLGDEVIVPVNSFVATALAVVRAGATPVFVDSDPKYHLIDVEQVATRVGAKTKAVLPVHLYGQMAPMEELAALARTKNILLIEDAAQSQGAARNGNPAGGFGLAAGTSFYPGKNLGAYGDAGAVLTNSASLAARVRTLRNYGSEAKYHHPEVGFNARLDTLQAVVLHAKLAHLREWNENRRKAARRYDDMLAGFAEVTLPATMPGNEHVWHLYVIRVPERDEVLDRLTRAGVGAGVHYPTPIHLQGAFKNLGYGPGDFPVAEAAAGDVLSLPLFPGIDADQQRYVVQQLGAALGKRHRGVR
jgi:dTDP-4-amino-4,6-dideoxygalactose transaminase